MSRPAAAHGAVALFLAASASLVWAGRSPRFVREDALKVPGYCGRLRGAGWRELALSREVGEDGSYYRPLENVLLGSLAKSYGCSDARPFRLAGGLLWVLCTASLVIPLRRAGAGEAGSWAIAAAVLAHPYNSWYFVSAVLACNPLLLPAAVGAWRAMERAGERGRAGWTGPAAALCAFAGCLARENAVAIPAGLALLAWATAGRPRGARLTVIGWTAAAAGAYLLLRGWVLRHDPAPHSWRLHWELLPRVGPALSEYASILARGSFRANGAAVPARGAWLHLGGWLLLAAIPWRRARSVRAAWTLLAALCASEIAASMLTTGEIMPVRATVALAALAIAAAPLVARARPLARTALAAIPLFWCWRSIAHASASRDPARFLELHSNPPYSWKIEGERAEYWLRAGRPDLALEAARASETLRPSWLTRALAASIEAIYFLRGPESVRRLAALAEAGRGEPAAHVGYVNLGVALARRGAWDRARDCFRAAAENDPNYAPAWAQWAWAETSLGNWPRAAELAAKAIELAPEDANSWQNLAYSKRQLGDLDGSAAAYRRLYELDPARRPR